MAHEAALSSLTHQLEYTFKDEALLTEALTHRSVSSSRNNERLEFLGDGILNFVIAARIFEQFPDMQEGDMSRLRASLVNKNTLADIARTLNLGEHLRLGAGAPVPTRRTKAGRSMMRTSLSMTVSRVRSMSTERGLPVSWRA